MPDKTPEIGPSVRRWRHVRGLSLAGLAAASGVSRTMLSEIERGRKQPTVRIAYQIACAFDCSLTEHPAPRPTQ